MDNSCTIDQVRSVAELVNALGGLKQAVSSLGVNEKGLRAWLNREKLPARLYLAHTSILEQHNITADPNLWGQSEAAGDRR